MQPNFWTGLLASLALASFARADYYIDDQNFTSLVYSENPGGAKWRPYHEGGETLSITLSDSSTMTVDASQCFNNTFTHSNCMAADNCQVQIPFTGSGITVYVLQAGAKGINASITVDEGLPQYNALPAPPGPNFYIPNVTLFSIQGITTGNHTAVMTSQLWDSETSEILFDYAAINQTVISLATGTAAPSASTPSPTASASNSRANVGIIVGGAIGGLAVLIAIAVATFCLCHKRPREIPSVDLDEDPKIVPFPVESDYHYEPEQYADVSDLQTTDRPMTGSTCGHPPPHPKGSMLSLSEKARLSVGNTSTCHIASANTSSPGSRPGSFYPYSPAVSEVSHPLIQQTYPMFTVDQADFVNSLYANNIPAEVIARVIERMIAGEKQPVVDMQESFPPPNYWR